MCCDRKKRRGRRCGLWVLSPSPVVFLDPVPPGGGDCPRQPGQQCDSHCSLGQCFCRACEWVPWACGSQDLDAGVTNLFHVIASQKSIGKMLFSLLGGRIEWMWKMGRAWAWSQAKVSIQALPLPHSVTVGNSLYLPERKCPWSVCNTGIIMLHSVVRKSQLENIQNSSHIVNTQ